ncbi:Relaxase/Mobilisation nuclease domain-containing protein [Mucilaginibacter pineti]|uniref:Relaxase/Mobilisation nuclease domain-containing protein n=1 Tax=Mucilaginibacter pineti TaxID=1391627 RepID=A0A1G6YZJ5_9SPHI|nr:relaxase/mobilization nuclease domain-containing protein [Mucilaginibacter pineti]SDD95731.1 Relaxase/Mobilisation nuclease domain-containing protein [Mucilaginibacter pineti]
MIGKIPKPGKSFGGCIEYNVLKKEAAILYADGVRIDKIAHTIADFNMQRKISPGLGQAVGHISLSWSPEDKDKLNDEKMVSIAKEYLQKMKIQDTQVLIVKHKDRAHPHAHIVYNRVDNEGKTISDKFQHLKNIKISKELTLKHGMEIGQGKEKVNRQQLKGIDKLKYELYDTIKAVSHKVTSMAELKQELLKQDIGLQFKYKSGTLEKQGISFSKGDYKFKGSEIDRSLSYGRLSKQIEQQAQQKQAEEQRPTLAQQLREVINNEPVKEQSGHRSVIDLFGHIPIITPEPEPHPYRRRKRKGYGQDNDNEQSQGISR